MDLATRQRLRAKQAEQAKVQPEPVKTPRIAVERINYACGHSFPKSEIENLRCSVCCRKAKHHKRREQGLRELDGRLPDGATVHMTYDAGLVLWTGYLIINEDRFEASASSQKKLLGILDNLYRNASRVTPFIPLAP